MVKRLSTGILLLSLAAHEAGQPAGRNTTQTPPLRIQLEKVEVKAVERETVFSVLLTNAGPTDILVRGYSISSVLKRGRFTDMDGNAWRVAPSLELVQPPPTATDYRVKVDIGKAGRTRIATDRIEPTEVSNEVHPRVRRAERLFYEISGDISVMDAKSKLFQSRSCLGKGSVPIEWLQDK